MISAALSEDVARANRAVHAAGLVTAFGHVSARLDGGRFLIPARASPALARPDRLLVMDLDGNQLEGEGAPNTEFWIHARIYAARPDAGAVVHVHAPACIVLGQMGIRLRPLHNSGALFAEVPLFERVGLIRSRELGDEVAGCLGSRAAMLLRGHGANVVADDVRAATVRACFLEEAARLQLRALAAGGGREPHYYAPEEIELVAAQLGERGPIERAWEYYTALADGLVAPPARPPY